MTASIGIWACGDPSDDVVLYRWEADEQTGFVTLEVASRHIHSADQNGQPIGDLAYDPASDDSSGTATGVSRRLFTQVVAAILRAYQRAGCAPPTAHSYYF